MVTEQTIINFYFGSSHGIKGTARRFNLSKVYVGRIIQKYKKENGIR